MPGPGGRDYYRGRVPCSPAVTTEEAVLLDALTPEERFDIEHCGLSAFEESGILDGREIRSADEVRTVPRVQTAY